MTNQTSYSDQIAKVERVIHNYFDGIYYGDISKLKQAFFPHSYLYGDLNGNERLNSLDEYLEIVKHRKSPSQLDEKFNMKILSITCIGNIAMAKLHVPMLGYNYYDFITLGVLDKKWKIINKVFSHVE